MQSRLMGSKWALTMCPRKEAGVQTVCSVGVRIILVCRCIFFYMVWRIYKNNEPLES